LKHMFSVTEGEDNKKERQRMERLKKTEKSIRLKGELRQIECRRIHIIRRPQNVKNPIAETSSRYKLLTPKQPRSCAQAFMHYFVIYRSPGEATRRGAAWSARRGSHKAFALLERKLGTRSSASLWSLDLQDASHIKTLKC
jgi:hypothetical protein